MKTRKNAAIMLLAWLDRCAFLGGIGALLAGTLLAACGGNTGARATASPPPPPTASGVSTGAQAPASPTSTGNGIIVSTSVNIPSNGPLSSLVAATPAASTPINGTPTITLADNGTTVKLVTGSTVFLALDSGHDWAVTVDNETVLKRVVGAAAPSGVQGVFMAGTPGQTTLTAVGEPQCRKVQPPCGAPTVQFRAQIAVA